MRFLPDAELYRLVVDAIFRLAVLTAGLPVFRSFPFGIFRPLQRLVESEQSVAGSEADWLV